MTLSIGETKTVEGATGSYRVRRASDGSYYCSCPSWKYQKKPATARTCKHLKTLLGDDAEEYRTETIVSERNRLTLKTLKLFVVGGKATLTVESLERGTHRTYRLQRKKDDTDETGPIFVSVLTGSDNTNYRHYTYLGTVWTKKRDGSASEPRYNHGAKSKIGRDAPSAKGAAWLIAVAAGKVSPKASVAFWHEGRCCFCGRKLTAPGSTEAGYGPDCAEQRDLPYRRPSKAKAKPSVEGTREKNREDAEVSVSDSAGRGYELVDY